MATGYLKSAFEYPGQPGAEFSTPTLSTKVLYAAVLDFTPQLGANPLERDDELIGVDEPRAVVPELYNPTWSLTSRAYGDTLGFLLTAMLGAPTTTAGNGVITDPDGVKIPTGAYRHVFTAPFGPSGYYPQTQEFIAAYKDQSVFYRLKGCATEQLNITVPESGGVQLEASGPACYIARISDPSLSVSPDGATTSPFQRAFATVSTWLSNSYVTVSAQDISYSIANPVSQIMGMTTATRFPETVQKDDGPITVTGSVSARQIDADDWDALTANTGFAATTRFVSTDTIASSYPYKAYITAKNCQYVGGGPDALSNRRRIGGTFEFRHTYAGTAGNTVITIVNNTSSYATNA